MITRREQLARFYLAEHARLQRIVAREVPAHAVEDACHTAWTVLLRRPDIPLDGRGVAWLRKVALTTGRRAAIRPREQPAGGFLPDPEHPGELPEPPATREASSPTGRSSACTTAPNWSRYPPGNDGCSPFRRSA